MGEVTTKRQTRAIVDEAFPASTQAQQANIAGQLWALRGMITTGDLVVMPFKSSPELAIGRCTSGYRFYRDPVEHDMHHVIGVEWLNTNVPRTAVKNDLLSTLNGAMTVFRASRNNAEARLEALAVDGVDPGTDRAGTERYSAAGDFTTSNGGHEIIDPPTLPTVETIRDRIRHYLSEHFKGHRLTGLVAEILRAHGYVCKVSPPGPDQGVDIIAGRGPLGLDTPTLIVEVKSEETPVGSAVVRGLGGAMTQHQADHGLLVAWGGLTAPARHEIRTQRLRLGVWDADDVLQHLFDTYDRLPDHMRSAIPLERTFVLDEDTG